MREAIERVIAELDQRLNIAASEHNRCMREENEYHAGVYAGHAAAYAVSIKSLKEVLKTESNPTDQQHAPES